MTHKYLDQCDNKLINKLNICYKNSNNCFVQQSFEWSKGINKIKGEKIIFFYLEENNSILSFISFSIHKKNQIVSLNSLPYAGSMGGFVNKFGQDNKNEANNYKILIDEIIKFSLAEKIKVVTLVTNPLNNDLSKISENFKPNFIYRNFTQILELENVLSVNNYTKYARLNRLIKKNIKLNNKFIIERNSPKCLEDFIYFYEHNFNLKNYTILPAIYLKKIFFELKQKNQVKIFSIIDDNGNKISSILTFFNKNIVEYFLPTKIQNDKSHSMEFLIFNILKFFKSKKINLLNFQSSKNLYDGTFNFKNKFKPKLNYYFIMSKTLCTHEELRENIEKFKEINNRFILPYDFYNDYRESMCYFKN